MKMVQRLILCVLAPLSMKADVEFEKTAQAECFKKIVVNLNEIAQGTKDQEQLGECASCMMSALVDLVADGLHNGICISHDDCKRIINALENNKIADLLQELKRSCECTEPQDEATKGCCKDKCKDKCSCKTSSCCKSSEMTCTEEGCPVEQACEVTCTEVCETRCEEVCPAEPSKAACEEACPCPA